MKRKIMAIILISILLVTLIQPALASTKRAARILELSGTVNYQKGGGERELKAFRGMSLSQGDRLITGADGNAVLEIDNDKKLTVGANSVLDLSQLSGTKGEDEQTRLNMWKGEVLTEIGDRLNTRSRFEIKTPTAVMGVRGTWFVVGQGSSGTYIAVIEGALYALSNVPAEQGEQFAAFLEENEQLTLDELASFAEGIQAEPLALEQLPLVALQDLQQNVDKLPPALKEQVEQNIQQVIEQKQQQVQQQLQQLQQQIQQILGGIQGMISTLSPPPSPPTGGGGGGDSNLPLISLTASNSIFESVSLAVGQEIYWEYDINPADAQVHISSSNGGAVSVATGTSHISGRKFFLLSGVGEGTATVTFNATKDGYTNFSRTIPVTVTNAIGNVSISSVSPNANLTAGQITEFTVGVNYSYQNIPQAKLYIGFNSGSNVNTFDIIGEQIVSVGTGTHSFTVSAMVKNWESVGDFKVYVNIADANHSSNWVPLAYAETILGIATPAQFGTIQGTVSEFANPDPEILAGVEVELITTQDETTIGTTITNSEGHYQFLEVPLDQEFTVSFSKEGYLTSEENYVVFEASNTDVVLNKTMATLYGAEYMVIWAECDGIPCYTVQSHVATNEKHLTEEFNTISQLDADFPINFETEVEYFLSNIHNPSATIFSIRDVENNPKITGTLAPGDVLILENVDTGLKRIYAIVLTLEMP